MRVSALLALLAATCASACKWTLYKQCDSAWARIPLGTSRSNTICSAGCAMSSVSMALDSLGEKVYGGRATPASLNKWLVNHGGYADSDLIVWGSVGALGRMKFSTETSAISAATIREYAARCWAVIANVRHGSHWVLVTGHTSDSVFTVNDPGFNQRTYSYNDIVRVVVYRTDASGNIRAFSATTDNEAHQAEAADLLQAAQVVEQTVEAAEEEPREVFVATA